MSQKILSVSKLSRSLLLESVSSEETLTLPVSQGTYEIPDGFVLSPTERARSANSLFYVDEDGNTTRIDVESAQPVTSED